jgi:hypothetical protein
VHELLSRSTTASCSAARGDRVGARHAVAQRYREAIPRLITGEAPREDGLRVGSKGGWLSRARHDAGIVWRDDGSAPRDARGPHRRSPRHALGIDHPATVATARFARDVVDLALARLGR